jgi:hypothetical protein
VYSPKSSYLDGFYKRLPENQNYESFPVFKKNTGNEYVLFLHSDGYWKVSIGTSAEGGFARSSKRGLPAPGLSKDWTTWMNNLWRNGGNFTILALNPVYPASYTVKYDGDDQQVTEQIEKVPGVYEKQNIKDDIPLYKNLESKFNIFLASNGR